MSVEASGAAFQRFVDALNRPRDAGALRAAVTDEVRIDRHGPGERGAARAVETLAVERFTGISEVARWVARTPAQVSFALVGAAWPDAAGAWGIEYAVHAGEFHNGGIWIARLGEDGRISYLSHHPFAVPAS